jgi:hypothetical protein
MCSKTLIGKVAESMVRSINFLVPEEQDKVFRFRLVYIRIGLTLSPRLLLAIRHFCAERFIFDPQIQACFQAFLCDILE